jgi:LL-diaminopimelate aminotransferase
MVTINENYLKLKAGYLFPEIARRVSTFAEANPDAPIIKLGIGDVTEPLPEACRTAMVKSDRDMGDRSKLQGLWPRAGLRSGCGKKSCKHDFQARAATSCADEIFISDGSKCDCGNILDIFRQRQHHCRHRPGLPRLCGYQRDGRPYRPRQRRGIRGTGLSTDFRRQQLHGPHSQPKSRPDLPLFPQQPHRGRPPRPMQAWVNYALKPTAPSFCSMPPTKHTSPILIPHSIYEIPGARDCAIEFRSFSKNAGFTGTRCAFTVVPKTLKVKASDGSNVDLHRLWNRRQSTKFNGVSYIVQRGAEAVYSEAGQTQIKRPDQLLS